jgi:hypothetical protein
MLRAVHSVHTTVIQASFSVSTVKRDSRTPLIRTLVIRIANYPNRLGPSGKFVENSTKVTCLETTGYRVKYITVLWLLELQIRRGRKVKTRVHTVNSNSRRGFPNWTRNSQSPRQLDGRHTKNVLFVSKYVT